MSADIIDARVQFALARARADASRELEVDTDFLEFEFREAMRTGLGFETQEDQN
jgi:hypothetical protein